MAVIQNKWIEKEKRKKAADTAPSYESLPTDNWRPSAKKKPRTSVAARATYYQTLRGVRK